MTPARGAGLLALTALGCGAPDLPPSGPSKLTDRASPAVAWMGVDGRRVEDRALRGKIAVITFFSKKCDPCAQTLPRLQMLGRTHDDLGIVGVAGDGFELDVRDQITTYQLEFPVVHDDSGAIRARFGVEVLPATVVSDRAGVVRWVGGPKQTDADLERAIEILRERAE